MEAFCNDESATDSPSKCLQDSFYTVRAAGHHIWMLPPPAQARRAITKYLTEKTKQPKSTSAVIVLPATQNPKVRDLLKGFVLLKQYSGQDRIYRKSKEGGCYAYRGTTQVWYDPPVEETHRVLSATGVNPDSAMLFASKVGGKVAVSLCDTGADTEYISRAYLRKEGLPKPEPPDKEEFASCAGAQSLKLLGTVRIQYRIGSIQVPMSFVVVDTLLPGVDVILGRSFLKAYRGIPDVAGGRLRLKPAGRSAVTIRSLMSPMADRGVTKPFGSGGPEVTVITAKQAHKALRKGAEYFIVQVRERFGSL